MFHWIDAKKKTINDMVFCTSIQELLQCKDMKNNIKLMFVSETKIVILLKDNIESFVQRCKINKEYHMLFAKVKKTKIQAYEVEILEQFELGKEQIIIINRIDFTFFSSKVVLMEAANSQNVLTEKENYYVNKENLRSDHLVGHEILERLVDKYGGIVKQKFINVNSDLLPMVGSILYFSKNHNSYVGGYGRDVNKNKATSISILESLERYFTSADRINNKEVYESHDILEKNNEKISDPNEFLYKSRQSLTYDSKKKYTWKVCQSLKRNEDVWILNQFVDYYDDTKQKMQERFYFGTSSGCAIGSSREEAMLYSIFELIERDAFLTYWQGKITPNQIEVDYEVNKNISMMIETLKLQGYQAYFYDITTEIGIPVVWTFLRRKAVTSYNIFSTFSAAGSHLNIEKALEASLVEAMSSFGVYNSILNNKDQLSKMNKLGDGVLHVEEMDDHLKLYSNSCMNERFKFLNSKKIVKLSSLLSKNISIKDEYIDIREVLSDVEERIYSYFNDIYVYQYDSKVLQELDLYASRVLIPGLIPMTFGEDNAVYSLTRVNHLCEYLGIEKRDEVNRWPHPFP